jgi:predicted RNA polymerase sigma factor
LAEKGFSGKPEAWLLTVARRKIIDSYRGQRRHETASEESQVMAEGLGAAAVAAEGPNQIPDQRLALMFVSSHPSIDAGIRAPLILQVILGLDAKAIASAFLMSPAAMSKRLVRAKEKIRQAGIPFRVPEREELPGRLDAVLDAVYAAFAEGWTDPGGTDVARRDLTDEAMFLAQLVTELLLELLVKTGAHEDARRAYEIAIGLERDPAVRRFLQQRQSALTSVAEGEGE